MQTDTQLLRIDALLSLKANMGLERSKMAIFWYFKGAPMGCLRI